ncbi:acetyl-CoA synthetase [Haloprofundus sp. MHR1]|uniref:acetyl-CoA synthetase n=1 Tax=Haloprofundus sp. MHR1 TaxID=2572921 RepID=UPI0010BF1E89|nr:acetyl-CoA synthetase [Haloprofundus sp. MHR1]QCJ48332.1 acetyl-CoA synthetase [Haloprofundus sp. MHR1]
MNVLGEIVARDRRSDRSAVHVPAADRTMSYHDFCTTAWKAGNVFRHLGLASGRGVEVEPAGSPESLLAFFGAALLGSPVRFEVRGDAGTRLVVTTADRETGFDPAPGTKLVVYGGRPTRPETTHWETEVWSENPAIPPYDVTPSTPALAADETYAHGELLEFAEDVVDEYALTDASRVVVRSSLSHPGAVVAGVVAPLLVGATVVLADADAGKSGEVAVSPTDDAPEPIVVDPTGVLAR